MAIDFGSAVGAYDSVARMFTSPGGAVDKAGSLNLPGASPEAQGPSFTDVLKTSLRSTIEDSRKGEELTKLAIEGKADLQDVVMAVNSAEVSLQTVLAVRDKVVSAYDTILRMPI
ncbi:flagellar hook-basal body complex protein FliE [Phaeovibrio sulfidiphilus]|uniref:Flagellar hook-basal body complex protein FliE n=1 Tax=Phaeovibrio sulfidiphilus TaxID=1220600 RepID=A0A8J6YV98_9PROT|nr:flagellar hook-basal body complex protein FliE [Phaeovibrio sulfidiphilus]MBE1237049.1 flagellar hook-basal body complex protein FliE [Phaeovibrio sulfidiphilus]